MELAQAFVGLAVIELKLSGDCMSRVVEDFLKREELVTVKDTLKAVVSVLPEGIAMFD